MNDGGFKSRKFMLALMGLLLSTFLVWFEKITGTDYVALNSILGGAYMAANAYVTRPAALANKDWLGND